MSFVQNTYAKSIGKAYAGLLADMGMTDKQSYSVETGTVRYGSAVCLATGSGNPETQVVQPDASNLSFRGVAIREHVREAERDGLTGGNGSGETAYLTATETVSVLVKGRIYVRVAEDVTAGDPVYFGSGADGTGDRFLGDFARSNLSSEFPTQVNNATFTTTASAGELAVLELS